MILHYSEQRKVWWRWLLVLPALICISVLVAVSLRPEVRDSPVAFITYFAVGGTGVLLALLTFVFSRYEVALTDTYVRFGYNGWRKEVEIVDVVATEEVVARFWSFGGLGWRIDLKGRIGYIVNFGPAVEITLRSGRIYVFNCLEPGKVVGLLQERMPSPMSSGI